MPTGLLSSATAKKLPNVGLKAESGDILGYIPPSKSPAERLLNAFGGSGTDFSGQLEGISARALELANRPEGTTLAGIPKLRPVSFAPAQVGETEIPFDKSFNEISAEFGEGLEFARRKEEAQAQDLFARLGIPTSTSSIAKEFGVGADIAGRRGAFDLEVRKSAIAEANFKQNRTIQNALLLQDAKKFEAQSRFAADEFNIDVAMDSVRIDLTTQLQGLGLASAPLIEAFRISLEQDSIFQESLMSFISTALDFEV